MHCRACGKELNVNMGVCMGCGVPVGKGTEFCPACGNPTDKEAVMCVNCGIALVQPEPVKQRSSKSKVVAGLLGLFLGSWGAHNFYIKRTGRAIVQLMISIFFVLAYFSLIICTFAGVDDVAFGFFGLVFLVGVLAYLAVRIWSFIEAILLLCGNISVNGPKPQKIPPIKPPRSLETKNII